ncbi:MAG: arginine--tRNA ligase [Bacilli bacterium]|nr:arginine--tRNA ligase [Bacilli bacterium]
MINDLEKYLSGIFKSAGYDEKVSVIKSKEENVDFQTDDLFKLAKSYHKAPMIIGEEVVKAINEDEAFSDYFVSVSLAKPGFININVSDKFINSSLKQLMGKDKFGIKRENHKIVIDYGGPNVAKPLHVGHLRSAIIGQSIYNILKYKGNDVIGDVHLGDIGLQIGQVIYGILEDFPNTKAKDINFDLDYLNDTYPKVSGLCKEDPIVKEKCQEYTKKLQSGDSEFKILWEKIMDVSKKDIKRLYDYLSVSFDYWYGESDAYKYFAEMIPFIEKTGLVREDDGAKLIDVCEEGDKVAYPPCIIVKKDGAFLYSTSDLGTIWQRVRDFNPDDILYVIDSRQAMYFEKQIFRIARKTGIYNGNMEFHGFGTVNGQDNKPYKTRDGLALKLDDLFKEVKKEFMSLREDNQNMDEKDLDKIVNAILKFADLQNDLTRSYIFDIKKFTEVSGKTGPYILYTYLRINKLLSGNNGKLSDVIYNDADRKLRLKLLEVTDVLEQAARERRPHYIANYVYDLAGFANNFYSLNKMSDLSDDVRNDYDIVLSYNNLVLKELLLLLGIKIPKRM